MLIFFVNVASSGSDKFEKCGFGSESTKESGSEDRKGSGIPEAQKRYSFTKVFHGLILNGTSRTHTARV